MSAEFYDSPEDAPSGLHALELSELRAIAADTDVLSLLKEIQKVALQKIVKGDFDTKTVEVALFIRMRIDEVQDEENAAKNNEAYDRERATQQRLAEAALESAFFDSSQPEHENAVKKILELFADEEE